MRVLRSALGAVIGLMACGFPAAAHGAEGVRRAVVFPFEGFALPEAFAKTPNDLQAVVELRFRTEGWEMAASPLLLRELMAALGCATLDATCAAALAGHLKVDALVIGKLVVEASAVVAVLRRYDADGTKRLEIKERLPETAAARPARWKELAEGLERAVWPLPAPAPVVPRAPVAGARAERRRPIAVLAVGAVGLALGGGALAAALVTADAQRDLDALGSLDSADDFERAAPIDARGRHAALAGQILVATAATALLTAALLALFHARPGSMPAAPPVAILPAPAPGGGVIVVMEVR